MRTALKEQVFVVGMTNITDPKKTTVATFLLIGLMDGGWLSLAAASLPKSAKCGLFREVKIDGKCPRFYGWKLTPSIETTLARNAEQLTKLSKCVDKCNSEVHSDVRLQCSFISLRCSLSTFVAQLMRSELLRIGV